SAPASIRRRGKAGGAPEYGGQLTLGCEAGRGRHVRQRLIRLADQYESALDATPLDEHSGSNARRRPERTSEVMNAESGPSGEVCRADGTIDIGFDEDLNAPQRRRRQTSSQMTLTGGGGRLQPSSKLRCVLLLHFARGTE